MTLLNNYYIIEAALKENSGFISGYQSQNYNYSQSYSCSIQQPCNWDTLQNLRLPNGLTLKEVKDDLVLIPLILTQYGKNIIHYYGNSQTLSKPSIQVPYLYNQEPADQYVINNIISRRTILNGGSNSKPLYQTPNDIKPNRLYYQGNNGVIAQRVSDYVMVGSGIENDTTPVTKNDYRINNILDNNVIAITNETDFFGRYHMTLENISNTEQTIREIGIFNCHLVLYSGNISTEPTEFKNVYSEITGLECQDLGTISTNKTCAANIPILFAKMKLTTPIVLRPGESIPLIWERKW